MRKLLEYEQEKRLARAKKVIDVKPARELADDAADKGYVHTPFTEAKSETEKPALPEKATSSIQ